ncbi:hypothetical protein BJY01DRAFT_198937 [Aspergillus pseudoustus]|uniref:Uncharacterized protein n=1 Tax=Aspergillus pseudoustus TaxID=1810923 RepID=A0ABR4JSH3_9EURO
MPRPAIKRNRLTAKALHSSKPKQAQDSSRDSLSSREISRSPQNDAVGSSRLAHSADPSEIIRQLRNQTPLGKSHEFAIASSPGTEQGATGSRPPTRARGYSSTLSIAGRKGDPNSRVPGTPAFESSILSNFRRRPRQASILQMMQDEDGSSEYDDDDFLGGLSPEDESTPLNITRGKSLVLRLAPSSPVKPSFPSSGKSSKRKRTIDAQAPLSPLAVTSSNPGSPTSHSNIRERESSTVPPPSLQSPAAFSETMAPPMSSPVPDLTREVSTPVSDRTPSRSKQSQTRRARKPSKNEAYVPTAALQDKLLPRRRYRRAARVGAFGIEVVSDSDDDRSLANEDEDELSFLPMRGRSQTRRKPAIISKPKSGDIAKQLGTNVREEVDVDNENELAEISSPLSSALDSDAFDSDFHLEQQTPKHYLSEELRLQALKFAEVDKWQMEFEDVITVQENGEFR